MVTADNHHNDYIDCVPDVKLTFEAVYAQHADGADDTSPRVADCLDIFLAIEEDATAALPRASPVAAAEFSAPAAAADVACDSA